MSKSIIKSFGYAFRGIKAIWEEEPNFRLDIAIVLMAMYGLYAFNFSYIESALIIFVVMLALTGEALNTVIERTLDVIQPNQDPTIGKIKDMMAGVILIGAVGAITIGILVFFNHFGVL